jgi:hypothetical protein
LWIAVCQNWADVHQKCPQEIEEENYTSYHDQCFINLTILGHLLVGRMENFKVEQ